jgi:hypothetical protein
MFIRHRNVAEFSVVFQFYPALKRWAIGGGPSGTGVLDGNFKIDFVPEGRLLIAQRFNAG